MGMVTSSRRVALKKKAQADSAALKAKPAEINESETKPAPKAPKSYKKKD